MTTISAGPRRVEVSKPDKVLFPEAGITKQDLCEYYREIADHLLPHVRDHPIAMHRYPDGIEGDDFFQKEVSEHFPEWIERETLEKVEGGTTTYVVPQDAATLVYLADQACITPHVLLARTDRPQHPDRMIFDLDPSVDDFGAVRRGAKILCEALEEVDLVPYAMTSGSRGIHIYVPLDRSDDFDAVRDFAHDLGRLLADRHPDLLTVEQSKDARGDRVFLDYLRNAYGQHSAAPYSVRPRPGAPVATPLELDEIGRSDLGPRSYTTRNLFQRLSQKGDPWEGMGRRARSLKGRRERLNELLDRT